jgi:NAD(P)H-nitrite reductase large subunit
VERLRYVIIGNSAAGIFAAEAIRKLDQVGRVDIISEEHYPAYARCLTSYYLTGKMTEEQLLIRPTDFYTRYNLHLHAGQKAVKVDPGKREVYTASGETYGYDKLLIATGASPVMPKLPGMHSQGVFGLRTLGDAKGILAYVGPGKHAVVVGGGFVSLKAAYALLKAGTEVTCVVSSGHLLSQMLDREAAALVAEKLSAHGLRIRYYTDVVEVVFRQDSMKGDVVSGVRLKSGEELPADVLIIGKGVTPNTGFLEGSGIELDQGIVVNQFMQTNLADIYAAGDVARGFDLISGERRLNAIWPNATEQGTVAGKNMAGLPTSYSGSISMNSADFFGLSAIAAGRANAGQNEGYEVVKLFPGKNLYRRLVFKGNCLAGYIMVGKTAQAGLLTSLVKERIPLGKIKEELQQGYFRQRALW